MSDSGSHEARTLGERLRTEASFYLPSSNPDRAALLREAASRLEAAEQELQTTERKRISVGLETLLKQQSSPSVEAGEKLVRDSFDYLPHRVAGPGERYGLLAQKLDEEYAEVKSAAIGSPEFISELADLVEVCYALGGRRNVETARHTKLGEKGGFHKLIVMRLEDRTDYPPASATSASSAPQRLLGDGSHAFPKRPVSCPSCVRLESQLADAERLAGEYKHDADALSGQNYLRRTEAAESRLEAAEKALLGVRETLWDHLVATDDDGNTVDGYDQATIPLDHLLDLVVDETVARVAAERERDEAEADLASPVWNKRLAASHARALTAEARCSLLTEALESIARGNFTVSNPYGTARNIARAALAGRVEEQSSEGISGASKVGRSGGGTNAAD